MTIDADLFERINALSREEEALYARAGDGSGLDGADIERLEEIRVQLDQVYDLLHQRQGRRDAGRGPRACSRSSGRRRRGLPAVGQTLSQDTTSHAGPAFVPGGVSW